MEVSQLPADRTIVDLPTGDPPAGNQPAGNQPTGDLRDLYRYMAARDFVASRAELLERGFGRHRLTSWRKSGRLIKNFRGIYSYGRDIQTRREALRASLLVAGSEAVLTGRVALETWGAVKPQSEIPRLIEVATTVDRAGHHSGDSPALRNTTVRVLRRNFEVEDVRRRDGLAVLRATLALIDFAATASETEVRFAFLELCRLRLFNRQELELCVRRATGKRGVAKLKPLFGLWVPELQRIRSVLEGLFVLAWVERGLKMPEVNEKIFGREVDMLWREEKVIVELDGEAFHSDPVARSRDLEKQRFLESKGFRVIRVTWKEFMADPAGAIERIARELGLT